jgi:hypothetical protein
VVLVLTRFGLRSPGQLVQTYLDYRTVRRQTSSSQTPGLLASAFLVEDPATFFSLSIWERDDSIPFFGTKVPAHVDAARNVFSRLRFRVGRGPELWSTRWRLDAVSNNLTWPGCDLAEVVGRA